MRIRSTQPDLLLNLGQASPAKQLEADVPSADILGVQRDPSPATPAPVPIGAISQHLMQLGAKRKSGANGWAWLVGGIVIACLATQQGFGPGDFHLVSLPGSIVPPWTDAQNPWQSQASITIQQPTSNRLTVGLIPSTPLPTEPLASHMVTTSHDSIPTRHAAWTRNLQVASDRQPNDVQQTSSPASKLPSTLGVEIQSLPTEPAEIERAFWQAVSDYDHALDALRSVGFNQQLSQDFYHRLVRLGELARQLPPDVSDDARSMLSGVLKGVASDPELFRLASAAGSGWINWPQRKSRGVVLAGDVVSVVSHGEKCLATIRTHDSKRSRLTVQTNSNGAVRTGLSRLSPVLFVGTISPEPRGGMFEIVGDLFASPDSDANADGQLASVQNGVLP